MKHHLTVLFLLLSLSAFSQKVEYSIPEGYEMDIKKKDYKFLVDRSVKLISEHYEILSVSEGVVTITVEQDSAILNLHNLILKCAAEKRKNWEELIDSHFTSMFDAFAKQRQLNTSNFETIVDNLSLRIYEEPFVSKYGGTDNLIVKQHLEGTQTLLMLDLPTAFTPVQKEMFERWGKTYDELFEIAQQNVNKQLFSAVTEKIPLSESNIEVHFIENEDYAASIALDLGNNSPDFVGEWGSVVTIPNKGIVAICKVSKNKPLDFMNFIYKLKPIVERLFNEHPQPISTDFYWYYKGSFTKINISENDGKINVIAPAGLAELMTVE